MRIAIYPSNLMNVGHFRLIWPAYAARLAQTDHEIEVHYPGFQGWDLGVTVVSETGKVIVRNPPLADVVVLQNPAVKPMSLAVRALQDLGIAVVVDVDDDYRHVNPDNYFHQQAKKNPELISWQNVADAVARADVFTCSTQAIAKTHGRKATILPNYVPKDWLKVERRVLHDPHLGWTGSLLTKSNDLGIVGDGVRQAAKTADIGTFASVGPDDAAELVGCGDLYHYATGHVDLADYAQVLKDHIDVGIIPLAGTRFNEGKSHLTGLAMASLGIPFVASPTAAYLTLSDRYDIGVVAYDDPVEWREQLEWTLQDHECEGAMYRENVARYRLTIEDHAEDWLNAWVSAGERRKGK